MVGKKKLQMCVLCRLHGFVNIDDFDNWKTLCSQTECKSVDVYELPPDCFDEER